jgi:hypothetical protein
LPEKMKMKNVWMLLVPSLLLFMLSCEQKRGERCQQNGDCGGALICCKGVGATPDSDGVCKPEAECTQADASTDAEGDVDADTSDPQDGGDVSEAEQESPPETVEETVEETGDLASEDIFVEEAVPDTPDDEEEADEAR